MKSICDPDVTDPLAKQKVVAWVRVYNSQVPALFDSLCSQLSKKAFAAMIDAAMDLPADDHNFTSAAGMLASRKAGLPSWYCGGPLQKSACGSFSVLLDAFGSINER